MVLTDFSLFCGSSSLWIVSSTIVHRFSMGFKSVEFAGASTLINLSEFFYSNWYYAHQNPKETINPSNATICAKLQAQNHWNCNYSPKTLTQCILKLPHCLNDVCFFVKGCWRSIHKAPTHKYLKCVGPSCCLQNKRENDQLWDCSCDRLWHSTIA